MVYSLLLDIKTAMPLAMVQSFWIVVIVIEGNVRLYAGEMSKTGKGTWAGHTEQAMLNPAGELGRKILSY